MASQDDRKRRGSEILKKYKQIVGNDPYAAAADAITDILLAVATDQEDAGRILQSAEVDYNGCVEREHIAGEG